MIFKNLAARGVLALGLMAGAPAVASEHVRASWYGGAGEPLNDHTADGARFNPCAMTAAHRSLPFGTRLRVAWRGRSVVVRVSDRGPARWTGRALDLSRAAAEAIGLTRAGVGTVTIERL
jgi:rare lipoprotein A